MMDAFFSKFARHVEYAVGSPWAFVLSVVLIVVWAATGPWFQWSDSWQIVINTLTTIITFLMVFLIQATQTRDTRAMHLKLDELLRAVEGARTPLALAEDMPAADLDALHEEMREAAKREGDPPPLS
jgi:low affinity Fe/Cu permease